MLTARLIADEATQETQIETILSDLESSGHTTSQNRPLKSDDGLIELVIEGEDLSGVRAIFDEHYRYDDAIVSERAFGIPQLLVSDMDSTMIGQECIDELADFAGLKEQVSEITERAMQGELDFKQALRERVKLLQGLEQGAIGRCLSERIEPMAGAKTLVATLKSKGCRTVLVTGGFHHFADPIAEQLGFERVVGNNLEVSEGALTGGLVGGITDSGVKKRVLHEEAAALGPEGITIATGDGANDIPMFEAATFGIAYHAKPTAREAADGWIDRGDLTSILRLFGIPKDDWVTG